MRNPSANTACMTISARPGKNIDTRLGPLSNAQRNAVITTPFTSASGRIASGPTWPWAEM